MKNLPLRQVDKHGHVKLIEKLLKVDRVYELVEKNPGSYGAQTNTTYSRMHQKKMYENTEFQEEDDLLDLF